MDIVIWIFMNIMVFQQDMFPQFPTYISITNATHLLSSATVAPNVKLFCYFQHNCVLALNKSIQHKTLSMPFKTKSTKVVDYEMMFVQTAFVDMLVVVPRVPVMGVFAKKNLRTSYV